MEEENTAGCHNVTENNHILRKCRGSEPFRHKNHTKPTGYKAMNIFYS
jgi:hypothetical protein